MIPMGDLNSGAARLYESVDSLEQAWAKTKEHWNDANARSFEETHLQSITPDAQLALQAIRHLHDVLLKARRECDPKDW